MNDITDKIGLIIEEARKRVYTQVNTIMVETYYEIGKNIVEYELIHIEKELIPKTI